MELKRIFNYKELLDSEGSFIGYDKLRELVKRLTGSFVIINVEGYKTHKKGILRYGKGLYVDGVYEGVYLETKKMERFIPFKMINEIYINKEVI